MAPAFNLLDVEEDAKAINDHENDNDTNVYTSLNIGYREPQTQKTTKRGKRRNESADKADKNTKKLKTGVKKLDVDEELAAQKPKLIVGIDFGTTYSGISHALSMNRTANGIQTIVDYPNGNKFGTNLPQVRSIIAYPAENKGLKSATIGYEVKPEMTVCTNFKLGLDDAAAPGLHDDPLLQEEDAKAMKRLPNDKNAVEVSADFLRKLKDIFMSKMEKSSTKLALEKTKFEYWVAVPAMWDDRAVEKTKAALKKAGFLNRGLDEIKTVTEPEAAAVAALRQSFERGQNVVKKNAFVIVIDLGGGTCDSECLKVLSVQPLKFSILAVGEGIKYGATSIDRRFRAWMVENFGAAFEEIPAARSGYGSQLMNTFEAEKKAFSGVTDETYRLSFPALSKKLKDRPLKLCPFDLDEGEVVIPGNDMLGFFREVITESCSLLDRQVKKVKEFQVTKDEIFHVILAGGLSANEHVFTQMKNFCNQRYDAECSLTRSDNPWSSISVGAAEFGLDRSMLISRVARRHYFMVAQRAFKEGVDPEDRAVMCPIHGKRVGGSLTVLLRKGQTINSKHQHYVSGYIALEGLSAEDLKFSYTVYASNTDAPPQYSDDKGVYDFGKLDIDLEPIEKKYIKKGYSEINMDLKRKPLRVKLNIVVKGGHGGSVLHLAANADRMRVGDMVVNYTT